MVSLAESGHMFGFSGGETFFSTPGARKAWSAAFSSPTVFGPQITFCQCGSNHRQDIDEFWTKPTTIYHIQNSADAGIMSFPSFLSKLVFHIVPVYLLQSHLSVTATTIKRREVHSALSAQLPSRTSLITRANGEIAAWTSLETEMFKNVYFSFSRIFDKKY